MLAERRLTRALRRRAVDPVSGPLIVSGLFGETKGVSQAARLTVAGLRRAGFDPIAHDMREILSPSAQGLPTDREGGVWIVHANAPEALLALGWMEPSAWLGRYRIAYWAYELPRIPKAWASTARAFHEIWVPSRFVAEAVAAGGVKKPIRIMPHPVALAPAVPAAARARFNLPEQARVCLAIGDLRSSAVRKNLVGAIEIYRRAVEPEDGCLLLVKTQSGDAHPSFRQTAESAAAGRPDIRFLDASLSHDDIGSLIASCNILLSPHRAEGFGLTLAEALRAGVPALATGWSGNMEFMTGLPDLVIGHTLVPVRDRYGVYAARGQQWAEPDVPDAVRKLQALLASCELRMEQARKGKLAVERLSEAWSPKSPNLAALARLVS